MPFCFFLTFACCLSCFLVQAAAGGTDVKVHHLKEVLKEGLGSGLGLGLGLDVNVNDLVSRLRRDPALFEQQLQQLVESEYTAIYMPYMPPSKNIVNASMEIKSSKAGAVKPLVFLHGMGDSCFNQGMARLTEEAGEYMGVYSVCIPTGDTRLEDTINGFLLNMDASVDVFAAKVQADAQLRGGFNCVGLSQGNNICRGYIQKYNSAGPAVATHLSVHGPVAGVASLPSCDPTAENIGGFCKEVDQVLAKAAYTEVVQGLLFQADYFREVGFVGTPEYQGTSQMAAWNNEGSGPSDPSINLNFGLTGRFAMIKANADTVVIPREGEWWGQFDEDYNVLPMKDTAWYQQDLFGLRSADQAGKLFFNSTEGDHLQFTDQQLFGWLDLYAL